MLQHYQQRFESVQPSSNESESESGSEEESESEYESESGSQKEQQQHFLTQRSDARQLRQCGSGVGGASRGPQPALQNYFDHLSEQYYCALALDGGIDPMSSFKKPRQWEEKSNCTYTDGKLHYNTNRSIGFAQNNNNDGRTRFAQEDRRAPIYPKPTTPKKEKEKHGYAYYESNLVNNGKVGRVRNDNNDKSANYLDLGYSIPPPNYSANYLASGYSILPPNSKPKLNKETMESWYTSDEREFEDNRHVVYGSKEYYSMRNNGSKGSSPSTSSTTSNRRITYM